MKNDSKTTTHNILLIVDDEKGIRNMLAGYFSKYGFTVLTAENGEKAYAMFKDQHIDLIISDIRMPVCDGVCLLERIRTVNPKLPDVILISGYSHLSEEEYLKKGAKKVVSKPFSPQDLMKEVRKSLSLDPI